MASFARRKLIRPDPIATQPSCAVLTMEGEKGVLFSLQKLLSQTYLKYIQSPFRQLIGCYCTHVTDLYSAIVLHAKACVFVHRHGTLNFENLFLRH